MTVATRTLENFIAGQWVAASSDRTIDDLNPADPDDVVARVPLSTADDARAAIAAAADAFRGWKATSAVKRGQILVRASRLLEERLLILRADRDVAGDDVVNRGDTSRRANRACGATSLPSVSSGCLPSAAWPTRSRRSPGRSPASRRRSVSTSSAR